MAKENETPDETLERMARQFSNYVDRKRRENKPDEDNTIIDFDDEAKNEEFHSYVETRETVAGLVQLLQRQKRNRAITEEFGKKSITTRVKAVRYFQLYKLAEEFDVSRSALAADLLEVAIAGAWREAFGAPLHDGFDVAKYFEEFTGQPASSLVAEVTEDVLAEKEES